MIDRPGAVERLVAYIHSLDSPPILVHGGGTLVDELQRRLGMEPVKVDGLRRSHPEELEAVIMALCGPANKQLVARLLNAGLQAVGLAGVDGGLLRVRKLEHSNFDLGFVGEIVEVHTAVIDGLIDLGMTPVVAPLSLGLDGQIYNVNADQVASALARSVRSRMLDFVSNVPGVLLGGSPIKMLDTAQARSLIAEHRIDGGMVPKLWAAISAVEAGVSRARIVDLAGLSSGGGTIVGKTVEVADTWGRRGEE